MNKKIIFTNNTLSYIKRVTNCLESIDRDKWSWTWKAISTRLNYIAASKNVKSLKIGRSIALGHIRIDLMCNTEKTTIITCPVDQLGPTVSIIHSMIGFNKD